jgi:hypothetical protein
MSADSSPLIEWRTVGRGADEADDLLYELDEWEPHERDELSAALTAEGVTFSWEGATLVVASSDEALIERILDEVDEALDLSLDPSADKVGYDLGDWTEDRRIELSDALNDASIPHGWVEDELFVHEEDEQAADALLTRVNEGTDAGDDGVLGAELLGELFVAADRLVHDPDEHEGTLLLVDTFRLAEAGPPPFGFDEREWTTILDSVRALLQLVDREPIDPDAVMEQATALRNLLRPLV